MKRTPTIIAFNRLVLIPTLLLAAVVAAGAQTSGTRFAVIGDYGSGNQAERDVANLVKSWNPAFIITTGDNNYPAGSASTIDRNIGQYYHDFIDPYIGSYGAGATVNRFFPCLGNHDWGDSYPNPTGVQPYLNYFTLPNNERYYEVVGGPVHFFAIDSDPNEPDGNTSSSVQAAWLRSRLASATEPWKLVYFHHPPYSSGAVHGSIPWMQWPFPAWGASAILSGHDHEYERIVVSGFPYFVNGLGGESIYSFGAPVSGPRTRSPPMYLTTDAITFEFINRAGALIDSYTLNTAPALTVPANPSGLSATAVSAAQINLAWADNASNEDGFAIVRSIDGINFASVAAVGPNVTTYSDTGLSSSTAYYYRVQAHNAAGYSGYSNTATATTDAATSPLEPPTDLTAAALSGSTIHLAWVDNAADEDGFAIVRWSIDARQWVQIADVGPNVTEYLDTGLRANRSYHYAVRAFNSATGYSDYSNVASARTRRR